MNRMADHQLVPHIDDPQVPALNPLLGPSAVDVINAALVPAGGLAESARPVQVRYVPSKSVIVQYAVTVTWEQAGTTDETVVAASGLRVPEGPAVLQADTYKASVWRYPDDPFLPGLRIAADPSAVEGFMRQFGANPESVQLSRRAYRASRRAVIEATGTDARTFLKVVRPAKVASLQAIHTAIVGSVPVPHSLGWSGELGIVAMQALPGVTLRHALRLGTGRLPHPQTIVDLLDALPEVVPVTSTVPDRPRRLAHHARLLRSVVPDLTERIDVILHALSGPSPGDLVPVHGDFHASQILIDGENITGLVDVDTAGLGRRVDDLASLLGQLATLGLGSHDRSAVNSYGSQLVDHFDHSVDAVALRLATAASIFGFATGPFRVLQRDWRTETERRIQLCEEWIGSAHRFSGQGPSEPSS